MQKHDAVSTLDDDGPPAETLEHVDGINTEAAADRTNSVNHATVSPTAGMMWRVRDFFHGVGFTLAIIGGYVAVVVSIGMLISPM